MSRTMIERRSFLTGLICALASPVIVRSTSLMQVRGIVMPPIGVPGRNEFGSYIDYGDLCLDYDHEAFFYAVIDTVEERLVSRPFRLPDVWYKP